MTSRHRETAELYRDNLESMAATYDRRTGEQVDVASWSFRTVDAWAGGRGVPNLIIPGDNVLVESRGYIRPGKVIVAGRKNVTVAYVTPGGIREARDRTVRWGKPIKAHITVVTVPRGELHGWDPAPRPRG